MPQAHARFVRTYNVNVHYSIQPETNRDGLYHITIDGYGTYLARPLQGFETRRQFKYSDLIMAEKATYVLIELIDSTH